jgi:hypothetical protein
LNKHLTKLHQKAASHATRLTRTPCIKAEPLTQPKKKKPEGLFNYPKIPNNDSHVG